MNKLSSLEDTKGTQFAALSLNDQIHLLDGFLTEVDKNQTHHVRLKQAYEQSKRAGWQDKVSHEERLIANLQALLDEGEELLDRLMVRYVPSKKKAKGKAAKVEPDPAEADPEILRIINSQEVKHD